MSTLNISRRILAYEDVKVSNNPSRRNVDWGRETRGLPVESVSQIPVDALAPYESRSIFSGLRTLTVDGVTEFNLVDKGNGRYRISWNGTGAHPGFRIDRGLTLSGGSVTITAQPNQTVSVTHTGGAVFGSVSVGDTVLIRGVATYDPPGPFNPLNVGEWNVLSASPTTLVLARAVGTIFQGTSETVAISHNQEFVAYSGTGVQVGDVLDILSGFALSTRRSYRVFGVTDRSIDFVTTFPVAQETGIVTGAAGIRVYSSAYRYLYLECDQSIVVRVNGDTSDSVRVDPWSAGVSDFVGVFEKSGLTYSLTLVNKSSIPAKIFLIGAK